MPFILFFKGGISKCNHLFEDISDQHIEEDIYNMIRGSLTIPGYIVITAVFISPMQIRGMLKMITAGDKTVFVYQYKSVKKLACLLIRSS